jgi:hypothetical protein
MCGKERHCGVAVILDETRMSYLVPLSLAGPFRESLENARWLVMTRLPPAHLGTPNLPENRALPQPFTTFDFAGDQVGPLLKHQFSRLKKLGAIIYPSHLERRRARHMVEDSINNRNVGQQDIAG